MPDTNEPAPERVGDENDDALVTLADAAKQLSLSVRSVRRLIANGYLPGYRVGPRALRVHRADVETVARRLPFGYED